MQRAQPLDRNRRERVHGGPELPQRLQERVGGSFAEERGRLDDDEGSAAQRLRNVRDRRELQEASDGGDLVWHVLDPASPGTEHFRAALDREEQHTGVDLGDRVELELERGDDAERAAATERPEELRLVVRIRAHELALRIHQFDRGDAVRCEAVTPSEPADPAAERVPDDADIR